MKVLNLLLFILMPALLNAQGQPLEYYLPPAKYDPSIPSPEQFFGFQVGEWHLSHDQVLAYYRTLDAASSKIKLFEYGRSHENRPLVYLLVTSEKNQANIKTIQAEHLNLTDASRSGSLDLSKMPIVLYQGFSIHGNEQSGANAAPLVAYRLAAAQDEETERLLEEAVILLDPSFNPDGMQRFSAWVNSNRNLHLNGDPNDREYDEPWPKGRYNHYWFDLNRDWLPGQQPESIGRIAAFRAWAPNILTDHHEMGANSSFFFMPGVQSRVNPLTPKLNQALTAKIASYHAAALDAIGSLYYTEEGFDDFNFGKGSTYPDALGSIGILFEQASSRGHLQNTINGPLSFPFTIRNQVTTALSTQRAAIAMRTELLEYQRQFYANTYDEAKNDMRKAFIVGEKYDRARLLKFVEMLLRQGIHVYEVNEKTVANDLQFMPGTSYLVPLEQERYKLILGMFQQDTSFTDSIFYDISAWTMPMAFNLEFASLDGNRFSKKLLGKEVLSVSMPNGQLLGSPDGYAFAFEWDEYFAPTTLYHLLKNGLQVKVATKPFKASVYNGVREFNRGTILVTTQFQPILGEALTTILKESASLGHLDIYSLASGYTTNGPDLGSGSFAILHKPNIAMLCGDGVNPTDAGEVWHLLDTRYKMHLTKLDIVDASLQRLEKYNVVILPNGSYGGLNPEAIKAWINAGGTLIAMEGAAKWLEAKQIGAVAFKKAPEPSSTRRPYENAEEDRAAQEVPGLILAAKLDLTHPIAFGYRRASLPVFRNGNQIAEPAKNPYSSPLQYSHKPLLAGYLPPQLKPLLPSSPSVIVTAHGGGRVVSFMDNPSFRAFWYGTDKLLANSIFFGPVISGGTLERK